MYASISKELMIFQNCFGVLSRIPNGSAGNIKLFRGQHIARELRVERTCSNHVEVEPVLNGFLSLSLKLSSS